MAAGIFVLPSLPLGGNRPTHSTCHTVLGQKEDAISEDRSSPDKAFRYLATVSVGLLFVAVDFLLVTLSVFIVSK